jgi:hypothetical protein
MLCDTAAMSPGLIIGAFAIIVVVAIGTFFFLMHKQKELKRQRSQPSAKPNKPSPEPSNEQSLNDLVRKFNKTESIEVLEACVKRLVPELGGGDVVLQRNDKEVEWRGTSGGHQARIVFEVSDAVIEVKQSEDAPEFTLEFDPSKKPEDESSTWDNDDDVRVFVGSAVFMSGRWEFLEDEVRAFASLPAEARVELAEGMRSAAIRRLRCKESKVEADLYEVYRRPSEFPRRITKGLQVTSKVADLAGLRADSELPPTLNLQRRTCQYCRALFIETPQLHCPNCGAAIEGPAPQPSV